MQKSFFSELALKSEMQEILALLIHVKKIVLESEQLSGLRKTWIDRAVQQYFQKFWATPYKARKCTAATYTQAIV